jgi:DnaJ-class molecular chaperone
MQNVENHIIAPLDPEPLVCSNCDGRGYTYDTEDQDEECTTVCKECKGEGVIDFYE